MLNIHYKLSWIHLELLSVTYIALTLTNMTSSPIGVVLTDIQKYDIDNTSDIELKDHLASMYLDADYQSTDSSSATWAHHNAYISDTLPTSVTHWTTDSPLVYALNITQDQGVPYNMTVKYADGTSFDLTANTWMTVDYSGLGIGNSTVTVTINSNSLGPYYNQTDNYELNFEVKTTDSTNSVTQNHLINVTLENGKLK